MSTKSKAAKTNSRKAARFPLGAGLLILGGLAPPLVAEAGDATVVRVDDGLVTLRVHELPRAEVVATLAREANLGLVRHAEPAGTLTAMIDAEPLAAVLAEILEADSYQLLYAPRSSSGGREAAGTLWIFSRGRAAAERLVIGPETQLLHGDRAARKAAIRTLRDLGDDDAVRVLGIALADADPQVREAALAALARIGTDESLGTIASLASVDHYWTRIEAANALSLADSPSAVGHLRTLLADADPRVRMAALEALADVPRPGSIMAIRGARQDPDPEVRSFAAEALEDAYDALALAAGRRDLSP